MVPELAALAGPGPVSRVESVSVRADALDTASTLAGDDSQTLAESLITLGERPTAAHAVACLCHGAHTRGQFVSRPGNVVVSFHDTPAARYLHLRRNGWVTFVPAGTTGLATHVRQLTTKTTHR
jgi:hypothetical protein